MATYEALAPSSTVGPCATSAQAGELGEYALELYTEVKTVYVNLG
jgi:hypothetical protein